MWVWVNSGSWWWTGRPGVLRFMGSQRVGQDWATELMVFPVVMYGCESRAIKEAECWRTDAFKLWCWRRLLRVPWTTRRSNQIHPKGNQSWIFTGRADAEAETPNTLATWCEELTHLKRPWCWERLKAGREGDYRGWDGWMASPTQWMWVWVNSRSWWWTGRPGMLQSMGCKESDTTEWTELFIVTLFTVGSRRWKQSKWPMTVE